MHVFSGISFSSAALEDRVERVADLSSFVRRDHLRILQRLAVSDAGSYIRFEQPAIEAIGVIELGEARIDLPLKSTAPKFVRLRHEFLPQKACTKVRDPCPKGPRSLLDTVSTTCGSGWVRSQLVAPHGLRTH